MRFQGHISFKDHRVKVLIPPFPFISSSSSRDLARGFEPMDANAVPLWPKPDKDGRAIARTNGEVHVIGHTRFATLGPNRAIGTSERCGMCYAIVLSI